MHHILYGDEDLPLGMTETGLMALQAIDPMFWPFREIMPPVHKNFG